MTTQERRFRPPSASAHRARSRRARPPRWPLAAVGVGSAAAALFGVIWLLTRGGEEGGGARGVVSSRPAAPVVRDATLVSLPTSYLDAEVGRLASQLRAPDLRSRVAAANALAALGPRAQEAVPALLNAMGRPSSEIEFSRAVGKAMKAIGRAAVGPLIDILRSDNPKARFYAAASLGKLGPDAELAVNALVAALEGDADYSVRSNAAAALGAIGPAAASAIPALRRAAGNPNEKLTHDPARAELRVRARIALDQIQGK